MDLTEFQQHIENEYRFLLDAIGEHLARWSPDDADVFARHRDEFAGYVVNQLAGRAARSYLIDLKHWVRWLNEYPHTQSPLEPESMLVYLEDRRASQLSRYTLAKFASTMIMRLKRLKLFTEPLAHAMYGFRGQVQAHFPRTKPRRHAPPDFLDRLARCMDPTSLRDVRDLALMTLLKESMVRPSEVLGLRDCSTWLIPPSHIEDLSRCADGSGRLIVQRARLGMRHANRLEPIYVSVLAMARIDDWLRLSGLRGGPLFRAFPQGSPVDDASRPMHVHSLEYCVKRLCRLCGITPHFSPSSMRAAMVNDMLEAGVHPDDVRRAARVSKIHSIVRMHRADRMKGSAIDVLERFQITRQQRAPKRNAAPVAMPQLELEL